MFARSSRRLRSAAVAVALLGGLATAAPAPAATQIQQPGGYSCGNGLISVPPVRVTANRGRTESVVWGIKLERWNGANWAGYSDFYFTARFNHFAFNVSGWSVYNTRNGGRFVNSRMNLPVAHRGSYRVGSVVVAPGRNSIAYVGGENTYCTI
jgi:hypothetical protein